MYAVSSHSDRHPQRQQTETHTGVQVRDGLEHRLWAVCFRGVHSFMEEVLVSKGVRLLVQRAGEVRLRACIGTHVCPLQQSQSFVKRFQ
jgi:hypothetical protein